MDRNAFWLGLILPICLAQRNPDIGYISHTEVRTQVGKNIELKCSVLFASSLPILWVKLPPPHCQQLEGKSDQCSPTVLTHNTAVLIRDQRFSLRKSQAGHTYSLGIRDVQSNDSGVYQCQIILNLSNKVTRSVDVTVGWSPKITKYSTRVARATEGQSVTLTCNVRGQPKPSIHWRRVAHLPLPTGSFFYKGPSFHIPRVKREDVGTYFCVADNGIGSPLIWPVKFEVEYPPKVDITYEQLERNVMSVSCSTDSIPLASIKWTSASGQILNSSLRVSGNSIETSIHLTPKDPTAYTCNAHNKHGASQQTFNASALHLSCSNLLEMSVVIKFFSLLVAVLL